MSSVARSRRDVPARVEEQTKKKIRLMYSPDVSEGTRRVAAASTTATGGERLPDAERLATTCARAATLITKLSSDLTKATTNLAQLNAVVADYAQPSAVEQLLMEKK
jgi:hypothetical protein